MDLSNYQQEMQNMEEDRYMSPSFNSCYSLDVLAKIADRASSDEFEQQLESSNKPIDGITAVEEEDDDDEDDDFEFSLVPEHFESLPAGGFLYDGQIGSVFPVFNRNLLIDDEGSAERDRGDDEGKEIRNPEVDASIGIPLKDLFLEEREEGAHQHPQSCSSSEVDELESVPPGTYCVWRPKKTESIPSLGKKSSSTGSASKQGKLRELLRRINSDGNDRYVFLTPKKGENSKANQSGMVLEVTRKTTGKKSKAAVVKGAASPAPSSMAAHEAFYLRSKAAKEGEKRKSYLPYRRELVGFFANVNPAGFGKTFHPMY